MPAKYQPNLVNQKKTRLEIDLKRLFGGDVRVPDSVKKQIAEDVIEAIHKRTVKGKDVNGSKFKPYSKSYMESDKFKKAGKSKKVNLILENEMLADMTHTKTVGNTITIGFSETIESQKAHGHNSGQNKNLPKRMFLGLQKKEADEIVKKYKSEVKKIQRSTTIGDVIG